MRAPGGASIEPNNPVESEKNKTCCGKCAARNNAQHAHCGKAYIIKNGMLKEKVVKDNLEYKPWHLHSLTNYIRQEFHQYFFYHEPVISRLLSDIKRHGAAEPLALQSLHLLFTDLTHLLTAHFLVEENVLFPHVVFMVEAKKTLSKLVTSGIRSLHKSIYIMENEHDRILDILRQMGVLTSGYRSSGDATESCILLYNKLRQMHEKIQLHINLEKNVLYPNTLLLEKELIKLNLL